MPLAISSALLLIGCDEDSDSPITVLPTLPPTTDQPTQSVAYSYGARPSYLINDMDEGPLKDELLACKTQMPSKTDFSISHRGAPLIVDADGILT